MKKDGTVLKCLFGVYNHTTLYLRKAESCGGSHLVSDKKALLNKFLSVSKSQKHKSVISDGMKFTAGPHLQLMRYKEHRLVFSSTPYGFTEDVGTHTSIDSTQRVIQQEYGSLTVDCTGQADSLTLPSTQISTSLPNL